jgi:hypothetical protein
MLLFNASYHLIYTLAGTTYLLDMWAILLARIEKTLLKGAEWMKLHEQPGKVSQKPMGIDSNATSGKN